MFAYILSLSLLLTVAAQNARFLAQRPTSMVPCTLQSPNLNTCLSTNLQQIFSTFRNGAPGLTTISGLDPITVERISIRPTPNTTVNLNIDLTNVNVVGASTIRFSNTNLNTAQNMLSFNLLAPSLTLNSNFAMEGTIINLAVRSTGRANMAGENISGNVNIRYRPRFENNMVFYDIDQFRFTLIDIGNVRLQFDNIFNGQKELEDTVNASINQNWRSFFENMYPAINDAFTQLMENHFRAYFSFIPANYLITDLPTSA